MAAPETARKRHASARASLRETLLASRSVDKRPTAIGRLVLRADAVSMAGTFDSRVPALATWPIESGLNPRLRCDEKTTNQKRSGLR